MSRLLFALLPALGGMLIAAQTPINARLRLGLSSPVGSGFISFLIGTFLLLLVVALVGDVGAVVGGIANAPWWAYLGGACGAVFVVATLVAAPKVGVTTTFVAVIVGQVMAATVIDRFGWLGQPAVALSTERVLAIGLMLVSLVLLVRQA